MIETIYKTWNVQKGTGYPGGVVTAEQQSYLHVWEDVMLSSYSKVY